MSNVCWGRVFLGGVVAGLIITVSEFLCYRVVMAERMQAAMERLGVSMAESTLNWVVWIIFSFVLGIAAVWLYAAIRPRYGPGVKTALCAGAAVWLFAYLLPTVGMLNMGLFPVGLMVAGLIWGLVEVEVATTVGAWLYQEPEAQSQTSA